jgi:hypothetical protein
MPSINTYRIDRRHSVRGRGKKQQKYYPPVPNYRHTHASRGTRRPPKQKAPAVSHRYPEGYPEEQFTQKQEIVKQYFPLQLPFAAIKRKNAKTQLGLKIRYSIKKQMFMHIMQIVPVVNYICNYFEITREEYVEFYNFVVSGSKEQIILSLLD